MAKDFISIKEGKNILFGALVLFKRVKITCLSKKNLILANKIMIQNLNCLQKYII